MTRGLAWKPAVNCHELITHILNTYLQSIKKDEATKEDQIIKKINSIILKVFISAKTSG
jgi:hypothetical protein